MVPNEINLDYDAVKEPNRGECLCKITSKNTGIYGHEAGQPGVQSKR